MSGRRAKYYRHIVYGGGSKRVRKWASTAGAPETYLYNIQDRVGATGKIIGQALRRIWRGTVTADDARRAYQALKRSRRGQSWRET